MIFLTNLTYGLLVFPKLLLWKRMFLLMLLVWIRHFSFRYFDLFVIKLELFILRRMMKSWHLLENIVLLMEIGGGSFKKMSTLYMISDTAYYASVQEWVKKIEFLYFCLSGFVTLYEGLIIWHLVILSIFCCLAFWILAWDKKDYVWIIGEWVIREFCL